MDRNPVLETYVSDVTYPDRVFAELTAHGVNVTRGEGDWGDEPRGRRRA
jgi:hypothetical protein